MTLMQNPSEIPCKLSSVGRLTSSFSFLRAAVCFGLKRPVTQKNLRPGLILNLAIVQPLSQLSVNFPCYPLIDLSTGLLELIRGK